MSQQPPPAPIVNSGGTSPSEIENMVRNFLAKGDTERQVGTLLSENYQYRERIRQLTESLSQVQAKVPADGALVLVGDDLKAYNEFLALKLKPSEVVTLQSEMTTLNGKVQAAERKASLDAAASAENYDPTVLSTLIGDKKLVVKKVEEEVDGEKKLVDRAFILTEGADKVVTEERLSKHVTDHHSKFLPSLKVEEGGDTEAGGESGTRFPRQRASSGGKATQTNASQSYIDRKYKTPPAQGAGK